MFNYSKNHPTLGEFLSYASFAYQLLYFKIGNKRLALNEYRERNLYPTGYLNFDITPKQREYLDIISLGEKGVNSFRISNGLRKELKDLKIDLTVSNNALNLFNFVKSQTKKFGKLTREAMDTFVNDEKLFLRYFEFIISHSATCKNG